MTEVQSRRILHPYVGKSVMWSMKPVMVLFLTSIRFQNRSIYRMKLGTSSEGRLAWNRKLAVLVATQVRIRIHTNKLLKSPLFFEQSNKRFRCIGSGYIMVVFLLDASEFICSIFRVMRILISHSSVKLLSSIHSFIHLSIYPSISQ